MTYDITVTVCCVMLNFADVYKCIHNADTSMTMNLSLCGLMVTDILIRH